MEDYLKLRSEALGSLGDEDGLEQERVRLTFYCGCMVCLFVSVED